MQGTPVAVNFGNIELWVVLIVDQELEMEHWNAGSF
jgi:hypothetical protein